MKLLPGYFALFFKGMAMGAADVVPGVSGGTIAFISGIYEQLLGAIGSFNITALKVLRRQGPVAAWRHVQGSFLLVLFCGIMLSVATFARLLAYLLVHYPLQVWGFFFGLILASVIYIWRQIPVRGGACWLFMMLGAAVVLVSAFAPHLQFEEGVMPHTLTIFGAGMLAICAMILPGVSGSFILLMLGMYPVILSAIAQFDMSVLLTFMAGCLTGLLLFSRFLYWLLHKFYGPTLAVLTGFLVGSLAVVWPWQQRTVLDGADSLVRPGTGPEQAYGANHLFWPWDYAQAIGESQWLVVGVLMIVGLSLVLTLEHLGGGQKDSL